MSDASGLRIGIVKPDYGVTGGFESLLFGLAERLGERGNQVELVPVDATHRTPFVFGYPIAPVFREWHEEYFRYLELVERTQWLDLRRFDVVCATQPPTYLAPHDRVFSLFFHHYRVFYDLAEEFVAAGFVDARAHESATAAVRSIDHRAVGAVRGFLAGSRTVADRLMTFWGASSLPYRHPIVSDMPPAMPWDRTNAEILCVSRLEWPKRTELFVAAMQLTAAHRGGVRPHGHLVGGGSRLEYSQSLDAQLAVDPERLEFVSACAHAGSLWRNMGIYTKGWRAFEGRPSGRVTFHGAVADQERNRLYQHASVVVAPAFNEDYGLTVLEAWQQQRPVIVCADGGGLTELVHHGHNGLVVAPTPFAIAQAIDRICNDPPLADHLIAGGLDSLSEITWDRALDAFEAMAGSAGRQDELTR
jgi:glycosyltransferase involved in cell wall biosynthesis